MDFKKASDSDRSEVLYNILTAFRIPMKLVRPIKCVQMKPITEPGLADIRPIRHFINQQLMRTICKLIAYLIITPTCVISGFRREVAENCALLVCYAANSGDFLPTFRGNLTVPFSGLKNTK